MRFAPLREVPKLSFNSRPLLQSVGTKSRSTIGVGFVSRRLLATAFFVLPRCQPPASLVFREETMRLIAFLIFAALSVIPLRAAEPVYGSKAEAVAMVKRVQEMFKKDGAAATFKAVSDPSTKEFHDRDLYPFIYTLAGICVAHGARPALIGKNLIDIKDQDGKYLVREFIEVAKGPGSGWVDYKWPNPLTNKIEDKSSYAEAMGDYFVGVGVYRQ
jgi:cytochrome c